MSSFPSLRKRQQRRGAAADEESAKVAGRRLAAQEATILLFSCYEGGKGVGLVLLLSLLGILGGREREEGLSWQRERVRRRRRVGPASRRGFSRDDFPSLTCTDGRKRCDRSMRKREESAKKGSLGGHLYSFSSYSAFPMENLHCPVGRNKDFAYSSKCSFLSFLISFLNSISLDIVRLPVFLSQEKGAFAAHTFLRPSVGFDPEGAWLGHPSNPFPPAAASPA